MNINIAHKHREDVMTDAKKKKTKKETPAPTAEKSNATIWVAIITGIVSITLGILGFPPLITYINLQLNNTPTPQPTQPIHLISSETPTTSVIVTPQETITVAPTPTIPPTFTLVPTNGSMNAQISYNYSTGNAPLNVSFNKIGRAHV